LNCCFRAKQWEQITVRPHSFINIPYTFEVHSPGRFEDEFKLFLEIDGVLRELTVKVHGTGKAKTEIK
jgi:hypothetical protein